MKQLRLRLPRRPDPVLDESELDHVAIVISQRIDMIDAIMRRGRVSESVLRERAFLVSALEKLNQVLRG